MPHMTPNRTQVSAGCGSPAHLHRRTLLGAGLGSALGMGAAAWLTPIAEALALKDQQRGSRAAPAKSVILLWMQGGPSQLETFDPHPASRIAAGTRAISTRVKEIRLAEGLEQTAEVMDQIALVRSVTSKEGDHERATYNVKTGFRPDPTLVHPALGAVVCKQLKDEVEIPRHVSILPGRWPARGGYLGNQYDAFKTGDPARPIPDVKSPVSKARQQARITDLGVLEGQFRRGRLENLDLAKTLHNESIKAARRMMSSEQLHAFDVGRAPASQRALFGDTAFGRGCLAALRLIRVGVRCVEVTLNGWDTHTDNHESHTELKKTLDPALAALIRELQREKLLQHTLVVCGGEFGRTPEINPLNGRDHWPHGFSIALAGGGIRGGAVYGATSPTPKLDPKNRAQDISKPRNIADIHATLFHQLGISFEEEVDTPIGRPMAISKGKVIRELLDA